MENKTNENIHRSVVKISIIGVISLLLLIPLNMVMGVIEEREENKIIVEREVAESYAKPQTVCAPYLKSELVARCGGDSIYTSVPTATEKTYFDILNYDVTVNTDLLHRSVYDVMVYESKIEVSGAVRCTDMLAAAGSNTFFIAFSDIKGLAAVPTLKFGENTYEMKMDDSLLSAEVEMPETAQSGDMVDFALTLELRGTDSLFFEPKAGSTHLTVSSPYPHPSFQGGTLPASREVSDSGFKAEWSVLGNGVTATDGNIGVKFVDPVNTYQQAMRSAKYGMLIIILVFVAALFAEFLTRRSINPIQYAVIGLSLVLFYSLLVAFSEFIVFGLAYLVAAAMTTVALTLYFKAILKGRGAYTLGGFIAMVYVTNYLLLQLDTYALLVGSIVLFILLCIVMYLTSNINEVREKEEEAS